MDKEQQELNQQASELLKSLISINKKPDEVRQLFIGNLPFRVKWQEVKDLFKKAGQVIRVDVALNNENRSKGHGTILFATIEEAQKAIELFNGYKWQGRTLEVRGDRTFIESKVVDSLTILNDTNEEQNVSSPTKQEEIEIDENCKQLFVGNIPFHCDNQDLKELFQSCGRIIKVDIALDFDGRSRGFGTVLFGSHENAKAAIEQFDGYEFHNRSLRVHFDKFAAIHQKVREQEAETYGQRKLQDPISVKQLEETYSVQPTASYNQLINGLLSSSISKPMQSTAYSPQFSNNSPYLSNAYYNSYSQPSTTNYNNFYSQSYPNAYQPNISQYNTSMSPNTNRNSFGYYQQSVGNFDNTSYQTAQNTYQPWMNAAYSPVMNPQQQQQQQQQQQKRMSTTTTTTAMDESLNRLSLNTIQQGSAGLNSANNNSNDNMLWNTSFYQHK